MKGGLQLVLGAGRKEGWRIDGGAANPRQLLSGEQERERQRARKRERE